MTTFIRTGAVKASIGFLIPDDPHGCWLWQGGLDDNGYAQGWNSDLQRIDKMHRAVWTWFHGRPPAKGHGLALDHVCRQRACVNPDHLELVTLAENRRRRDAAAPPRTKRPIRHGTLYGYTRGCRCPRCATRWSAYYRERRYQARCDAAVAADRAERRQRHQTTLAT